MKNSTNYVDQVFCASLRYIAAAKTLIKTEFSLVYIIEVANFHVPEVGDCSLQLNP